MNLELAKFLYRHFENMFSRDWEDLPEYIREHWLQVARELEPELRKILQIGSSVKP